MARGFGSFNQKPTKVPKYFNPKTPLKLLHSIVIGLQRYLRALGIHQCGKLGV